MIGLPTRIQDVAAAVEFIRAGHSLQMLDYPVLAEKFIHS